jgi:nucleoid DNA-binding protein/predicted RNA-binding Zn-ribbon protein involved in translation (DUF1610 family)
MPRIATTAALIAQVADELHLDTPTCRAVVREFLRKSAKFLAENGAMTLEGLGSFRVSVRQVSNTARLRYKRRTGGRYPKMREVSISRAVHVSFTKSERLARLARDYLEEHDMEKLGVDEGTNSEQLEKQAAAGCPDCGLKVEKHGKVLSCPRCGTEPFEREKNSGQHR